MMMMIIEDHDNDDGDDKERDVVDDVDGDDDVNGDDDRYLTKAPGYHQPNSADLNYQGR